jgi:Reverse transcriptase (RNA-dependent DNA polymerase)/Group II intron, maturase-specific domain
VFYDTISGTPQGGIISPVLANLALDGLERRLRSVFPFRGKGSTRGRSAQVHLIRYADDFIITGHSRESLEATVKPLVESFLRERGLELSPEKTAITHVTEGFDFLGQNVRRYPCGKLLIKPARKSIKSLLTRVKEIVRKHLGDTAHRLIARLNPVIRGWANYHRHVVSNVFLSASMPRSFGCMAMGTRSPSPQGAPMDQMQILRAGRNPGLVVLREVAGREAKVRPSPSVSCRISEDRKARLGKSRGQSLRPLLGQLP